VNTSGIHARCCQIETTDQIRIAGAEYELARASVVLEDRELMPAELLAIVRERGAKYKARECSDFCVIHSCLPRILQSFLGDGCESAQTNVTPTPGNDERPFYPEYGRESAGGVCPGTYAGLPCEVIVTVSDVKPVEVAVITLVPE
jgi:hypothetical protein